MHFDSLNGSGMVKRAIAIRRPGATLDAARQLCAKTTPGGMMRSLTTIPGRNSPKQGTTCARNRASAMMPARPVRDIGAAEGRCGKWRRKQAASQTKKAPAVLPGPSHSGGRDQSAASSSF
jgi:hypothetical protein